MNPPSETQSERRPADPDIRPWGEGCEFREYQAPRDHGGVFVEPRFSEAADRISCNVAAVADYGPLLTGLRGRARRQLVEDAISYTRVYRDVGWVDAVRDGPIIMAGHQPALFHPGVWFKNFALSHVAENCAALAINLVVDNDVASGSSIRVPTMDAGSHRARYQSVGYDRAGGGVPYEQTTIRDRTLFDHFDERVREAIGPIVADPCVDRLWTHAKAAVERCGVAGCALAQARHGLEGEIGLKTLEVPLGVVCRGSAFAEFTLAILGELPRFVRCYNEAANRYRQVHGIRSTAHPVPNLAEEGQWFEAPLWIYGNDAPTRKAAWVRLSNDHLVISDRAGREVRIDVGHPKLAAEQLAAAATANFKLRPRALLTTMYTRLVLCDLFLHGIGGAKYDQLGDMIMRSFFAVTPPQFMVISATIKLPGISQKDHTNEISRIRRQIRETRYQGERFADRVPLDPDLIARKQALLAAIPPRGHKKDWQQEIDQINVALSKSLGDLRASLQGRLADAQRDAASQNVLSSREHPFCLFPLSYLRESFDALLRAS